MGREAESLAGIGMPFRSKRIVGADESESFSVSGVLACIHSREGSLAGAVGKKRRRISSGVPSSRSSILPFSSEPTAGVGGSSRRRVGGFHWPIEIVGPSPADGAGNARAFLRGEGGADSYMWMSSGVTSAKRIFRSARLEGRVLLAEVGSGEDGRIELAGSEVTN